MARANLVLPEKFDFQTEISIRITDLNYGAHLANDALLSIVHEARVRFLNSMNLSEKDIFGVGLILSDAVIIYKSEAFYGSVLKIQVTAGDFSKVGCDFYYKIMDKATEKEVARVKTGIVFFNYDKRKVALTPQKFKNFFS